MAIDKNMILHLDDSFSQVNDYIKAFIPSKIFIFVDENTHQYCLPILLGNLETEIPFEIIEIESGEENKTISTAIHLWEILSEFEADRKSLIINLGGGVISDIGGFVTSTYKRGVKFINIPTSLLAMVDASIGGKTGVNNLFYKNIIGTFAQAENIFIYPNFLKTLDFRELKSGFAEMLKHGLIANKQHWNELIAIEEISPRTITPLIFQSINIKKAIVQQDFQEKNKRKTLNFGHTIGHSLESLFLKIEQPILHGEAIAIGMVIETYLSFLEGLISEEITEHIIQNIGEFYAHIDISHFSDKDIISVMFQDKKNQHNKINFSLLSDLGKANYDYQASIENIFLSLDFYRNLNI